METNLDIYNKLNEVIANKSDGDDVVKNIINLYNETSNRKIFLEYIDFISKSDTYNKSKEVIQALVELKISLQKNDSEPLLESLSPSGTRALTIDLDRDGKIIIQKRENAKFMDIYNLSHKLLLSYEKSNNIQGMKYELCKLWFMNTVIESKFIHPGKFRKMIVSEKKKEETIKARSFILNDFKKYLNIVGEKEPDFNFDEYYLKSIYGRETYKIDPSLIKALVSTIA